jgi:hypothetical protein
MRALCMYACMHVCGRTHRCVHCATEATRTPAHSSSYSMHASMYVGEGAHTRTNTLTARCIYTQVQYTRERQKCSHWYPWLLMFAPRTHLTRTPRLSSMLNACTASFVRVIKLVCERLSLSLYDTCAYQHSALEN